MSLDLFIIARDNDDILEVRNLIINHWNDEYIQYANQDILMDIVEFHPSQFYKVKDLLEQDNLIFCMKYYL